MADDWYRRYPKDALSGMRMMTLEEIGAYNIILDTLYLYDRALPDDDRLMAHLLRCHINKWKKIKSRLTTLDRLRFAGGYIEDARWLEESSSRVAERLAKSEAGVKGGVASGIARKINATDEAPVHGKTNKKRREENRKEDIGACFAGVLDPDHVKAVIVHRQKLKKPLTGRAAALLAKQLAQHPDPNAAADHMIMRGWLAFDPAWASAQKSNGPVKSGGGWRSPVEYDDQGIPIVLDAFGRPFDEVQ